MANPTTQVSLSSVLKRAGKSVETVLSVVDILDDGITIASTYMSRVKEEQVKEQRQKTLEFDNELKIRKANAVIDLKASAYQIGNKARKLQAMNEYEENLQAFEELVK